MLICGKTTIGFCPRVKLCLYILKYIFEAVLIKKEIFISQRLQRANTKVGSKNKVERIYQAIGQKKF